MIIWKYELTGAVVTFAMPNESQVLTLQVQNNKPYIWALCDPDKPIVQRKFETMSTGETFDGRGKKYVGTFIVDGGSFVGHVFEVVE